MSLRLTASDIGFYVPARNAADTLAAAVAAIRSQTLQPADLVLVVDTRSEDATLDVARSLGERIVAQCGGTLGWARNLGLNALETPWIASCDADVTLSPTWLERVSAHRPKGYVGIGGCTHEKIVTDADQWRALNLPHNWGDAPLLNPFMLVSEVMFRRDALLAVGGYPEELSYNEDSELCQRLRDAGYDLFYTPDATAWHYRADGIADVLNLRWSYSENRQSRKLERFDGLIEKLAINRAYALSTLARSVARGYERLSYISFLLFYHHIFADLRGFLRRRSQIDAFLRTGMQRSLLHTIITAVTSRCPELGVLVAGELRDMAAMLPASMPDVPAPPRWTSYISEVRTACASFADEFDVKMVEIFQRSAAYLHGEKPAERVPPCPPAAPETIRRHLTATPPDAFLTSSLVNAWTQLFAHLNRACVLGDASDADLTLLGRAFPVTQTDLDDVDAIDSGTLGVILHLERQADPLGCLSDVVELADSVVVCYSAPDIFLGGLDSLQARDLAATASRCGMLIDRFDTLVGRTILALRRPVTAGRRAVAHPLPL